jgi:hypothetical protein
MQDVAAHIEPEGSREEWRHIYWRREDCCRRAMKFIERVSKTNSSFKSVYMQIWYPNLPEASQCVMNVSLCGRKAGLQHRAVPAFWCEVTYDHRMNSGFVTLFTTGGGPSVSGYGKGAPRGGLENPGPLGGEVRCAG